MLADRQYGFPLQIPGCAESVFRYVCQQPVFQQEKCIQFLFGCIQLLLQHLIIRGQERVALSIRDTKAPFHL